MKKVLLTMFMAVTTLVAMAQTTNYTDNLVVTINGTSNEPQKTDITVEQNNDGTYTLSLNKFTLISGEDIMPVGNIVLENIEATEENGIKSFAVERNISITAGDENEGDWLGPMLGEVPVSLTGKMDAEKLYCTIDIDMSGMLGQVINVVFGDENFSNNANSVKYTDNLVVTINGTSNEPQKTDITVEQNNDGTYTLSLNKFTLVDGEDIMPVGNIVLENIEVTEEDGIKYFAVERNIVITAGDENEGDWIGPMLGEVPVSLAGKMNAEKLYCAIDIDMSMMLGQVINVVFGDDNFSNNTNSVKYTDDLVVTINGISNAPQKTDIIVEQNNDGTYTLSLNKFTLVDGEDIMPVGNIVLENIEVTEEDGIKYFAVERNIVITAGDENEGDWIGPMLGEVPVSLTGKMDAEKLYCTIDIDMSGMLGQVINVVFGDENTVTNINNITVENDANVIYDITGRRVNEITEAGIYIVNGKKILVK